MQQKKLEFVEFKIDAQHKSSCWLAFCAFLFIPSEVFIAMFHHLFSFHNSPISKTLLVMALVIVCHGCGQSATRVSIPIKVQSEIDVSRYSSFAVLPKFVTMELNGIGFVSIKLEKEQQMIVYTLLDHWRLAQRINLVL